MDWLKRPKKLALIAILIVVAWHLATPEHECYFDWSEGYGTTETYGVYVHTADGSVWCEHSHLPYWLEDWVY